jgi:hypothetical protein
LDKIEAFAKQGHAKYRGEGGLAGRERAKCRCGKSFERDELEGEKGWEQKLKETQERSEARERELRDMGVMSGAEREAQLADLLALIDHNTDHTEFLPPRSPEPPRNPLAERRVLTT